MRSCLEIVTAFIDQHIHERLTVSSLADLCGKSFHAFRCGFTRAVGVSPRRYVILRRVRAARRLLADTDMPLVEVAYATGFSSQAKFTAVFKREVGVTPGEFRRSAADEPASQQSSPRRTTDGLAGQAGPARSSGSNRLAAALPVAWISEGFPGAHVLLGLL